MSTPSRRTFAITVAATAALLVGGPSLAAPPKPPLALAPSVDLPRYMGDWYVIANIPTKLERGAHNTKETYRLNADGTVATTFSFRVDSFEGTERSFNSKGIVLGGNNAIWAQQYVWPIRVDYRIAYVSDDYALTVVAREKRDHVWILARKPAISAADYDRMVAFVGQQGYDTARLQRVPQQPR